MRIHSIAVLGAAAFAALTSQSISAAEIGGVKLEPYAGVLGGYHTLNVGSEYTRPGAQLRGDVHGALIEGVAGVNVPLGSLFFVGVEGDVSRGFDQIRWEYGVRGRVGVRTATGGLLFLTGGTHFVDPKGLYQRHNGTVFGGGVELGAADLGLSNFGGEKGPRLRLQFESYDLDSLRPMAGVVFHF